MSARGIVRLNKTGMWSSAWLVSVAVLVLPGSAAAAIPSHVFLAESAVGQGQVGTIKGRLVWGDEKIPEIKEALAKGAAAKNGDVCAANSAIMSRELVVDTKTKGVSYAFAFLVKPKGNFANQVQELVAKTPKVVLDQKGCEFQPYVLPFQKDQVLEIKSSDPVGHNVRFSGFSNTGVNQMVAANGTFQIKNLVAESRPMQLHCDIHNWMTGYLMVFDHPFFATTGTDGSFEIKGVPAGDQKIVVWQERAGYVTEGRGMGMPVSVKAGEVTDIGEIKLDPARALK
jgi:hypothetical protein